MGKQYNNFNLGFLDSYFHPDDNASITQKCCLYGLALVTEHANHKRCYYYYVYLTYPIDDVDGKNHDWSTLMLSPLLASPANSSTSLRGVGLPLWLDGLPYPLVKPNKASSYDTHRFETVQPSEEGRSMMLRPRIPSHTSQLDSVWDLTGSRGMEGMYVPHSSLSSPHITPNGYQQNLRASSGLSNSKRHVMSPSKRSDGGKIPTMGLGKRSTDYVSFIGIG